MDSKDGWLMSAVKYVTSLTLNRALARARLSPIKNQNMTPSHELGGE
jgi:hypothetical protein